MANRIFIIFADFDGVVARVHSWRSDTLFTAACKKIGCPEMGNLDIYAFNRIDRLCRALDDDVDVWLVSTSCWKQVFDKAKNRNLVAKWAGLQRLKLVKKNRKALDRLGRYEPYTRIKLIHYYLKKYKPADFVVLDDNYEFAMQSEFGVEHFILTDLADGLTYNHYAALVKKFSPFYKPDASIRRSPAYDTLMTCVC